MKFKRSSGILLHPTSLPGPYGIGELGKEAFRWVDFLADAGCALWQVLPLGPTGFGDSPYQVFSSFAGNPYLIDLDALADEGLLEEDDFAGRPLLSPLMVDYGLVIPWKMTILERAFNHFRSSSAGPLHHQFAEFQRTQSDWLENFSLFMALKDANGGAPWCSWERDISLRAPEAMARVRGQYADGVLRQAFFQFLFFRQWTKLKDYAHKKGITIIGDIPIFVAHDSADVWANPELFSLKPSGQPSLVAGVPPDYFSPTGQLWGNPLYRWKAHAANGYSWWLARLRMVLSMVDIIRLDHFRGFAAYWEVPAGNTTAEIGRWVSGPGAKFFNIVQSALGDLPLIAEDLGEITPDVYELRDRFNLPGMKILQFSFDSDATNKFLPHNFTENFVVYTGTHDNDTTRGWYKSAPQAEKDFCRRYLGRSGDDIAWDLIRMAWSSVAVFALAPMQDFLNLDTEARMNYPGRASGNWCWRMPTNALNNDLAERIRDFNLLYRRFNEK